MNREHIKAIAWLRWRLLANVLSRKGLSNTILAGSFVAIALAIAIGLFSLSVFLGLKFLPLWTPWQTVVAWDILAFAYAASWIIGLGAQFKGSAALSIEKLLHLPVSPASAFLSNFISSFAQLNNVLFVPPLLGFSVASIAVNGVSFAVSLLATLALVFMATALSCHLQERLATAISNNRKKQTIIAFVIVAFMSLTLASSYFSVQEKRTINDLQKSRGAQVAALKAQRDDGLIDESQFEENRDQANQTFKDTRQELKDKYRVFRNDLLKTANAVVPIGWLPNGIHHLKQGRPWPAYAGVLGMLLIGSLSLFRSYRMTLDHCQGGTLSSGNPQPPNRKSAKQSIRPKRNMLEWSLPAASEPCSAIATSAFRMLLRMPELKTILATPIYLVGCLGGIFYLAVENLQNLSEAIHPIIVLGIMSLAGLMQLMLVENQFNLDSERFKRYLLLPCDRAQLLIGNNLAASPFALVFGGILLTLTQFFIPISIPNLIATVAQYLSVCTVISLIGNGVAIFFPINSNQSKFAQAKHEIVSQFLLPVLLGPIVSIPIYIPFLMSFIFRAFGWANGDIVYLIASIGILAIVILAYRKAISKQADQLQKRETRILDIITE